MKHTLSLFLPLLMVFSVFSCLNTSAAENGNAEVGANRRGQTGACTWTYNPDTCKLTIAGNGYMADYSGNVSSPWKEENIIDVEIKEGVLNVGNAAFAAISSIKRVTVSSSVKTIGRYSFLRCYGLIEVNLADSIESIDTGAFEKCSSLKQMDFPNELKIIGIDAFAQSGLLSVDLTNTQIETIGKHAFVCRNMTEISLPRSIKTIGSGAIGHIPNSNFPDEYQYSDIAENFVVKGYSGTAAETYVGDTNGYYQSRMGWVFIPLDIRTISFNSNGGTGYMQSVKVKEGEKYELPECGFAPPAGKEFRCWLVGTYMNPGSNFIVSMDTTVTAVWRNADENKCTISFDSNGGSGTMYNVTVNKGSFYNAPECTFTAPEGRQFSHWTVNGERFDGGTIRENTVLKANWVGATVAYMDCSIPEPVVGERPSYVISVPNGAAYQQEWNYTGGLWGDGVAWEDEDGDSINYLSNYTFKPGRTYRVTISLVPVGGAVFAQSSALRGYINGEKAECFRYNANNVTLVRTFTTPSSKILTGDANLDGSLTIKDVTAIQRHVAELDFLTGDALIAADANGDGTVDITDATHLQLYLAEYDVVLGKK